MRHAKSWYFGVTCLLLAASQWGCGRSDAQKAGAQEPAVEKPDITVRAVPAQQRSIASRVAGLGHCEALPDHAAMLSAAAEGRVAEILVPIGGTVTRGQEIVRLDTHLAEANLAEKKTALDAQDASFKLFVTLPREEEQKSAKLAIEQAQLTVEKSRATVDHLAPLRDRGEVSQSAFHEAELALHQAQLQLQTAQTQYNVLMLRPRPEAIDEAQAKIKAADAAVATAQAQLDQLVIRSPLTGVLDSLNCQIGQTLSVGTVIGQVVDSKQVAVVAWIAVADARQVKLNSPASIRPESRSIENSDGKTQPIEGKVLSVGTVTDPQSGNIPVRVLVDNAAGRLTLGQMATVSITIDERKVLAVPSAAIFDSGDGPLLNVVRSGSSAVLHPKLGQKDGDWIETSGVELQPGEMVIVEGGYNLPKGKAVEIEKEEEKPEEKSVAKEK